MDSVLHYKRDIPPDFLLDGEHPRFTLAETPDNYKITVATSKKWLTVPLPAALIIDEDFDIFAFIKTTWENYEWDKISLSE